MSGAVIKVAAALGVGVVGIGIAFAMYWLQCRYNSQSYEYERPSSTYTSEKCKVCCICLQDFTNTSVLKTSLITLTCQHKFHQECIKPIIVEEEQKRCPSCRANISKKILDKFKKNE